MINITQEIRDFKSKSEAALNSSLLGDPYKQRLAEEKQLKELLERVCLQQRILCKNEFATAVIFTTER